MSYTLRGRLETRLAAALPPFLVAAALAPILHAWWPLELVGVMLAVGLVLDVALYHRLLPYQPGWAALPLGLLELGLTMVVARALELNAPLRPALALFAGSWLVLQVLAHAGLPLLRLTWPEDGGELGRAGRMLSAAAPAVLLLVVGTAWAVEPPTVRLAAGVHQGPLVLDHAQTVIGREGTVVNGGIVITADDVTVRNVTVRGGEYGIEVDGAESVELDDVVVEGAKLDGINVRRGQVEIRDCVIRSLPAAFTQGIDISFGFDLKPSLVERLHGHRRAGGDRHPLRAGDDPRQPRQQDRAARDHDDGDVDGSDRGQRGRRRARRGDLLRRLLALRDRGQRGLGRRARPRVRRPDAARRRDPGPLRRRGRAGRQRDRPQPRAASPRSSTRRSRRE